MSVMKAPIRCCISCISCILPCGALDLIRIVHASGHVEEISGTVTAGDIMRAYPKHVLRRPLSPSSTNGVVVPEAVILPPSAELRKGKIYFLIPVAPPAPGKARSGMKGTTRRSWKKEADSQGQATEKTRLLHSEPYSSDTLSKKASTQTCRRRGRIAVWRPRLESISEISDDLCVNF
ncbi:unnamed protein product [Musa acuminata subsp. malaccensis]|uniref:(wild Malaysian banana) hypothetical protein n=1 Tax=Musa acuminata subsp. malaccensis TaxID=214687 RepID=A0A804K084_MUSAM|nr:PREDICTED: uncharacterized protein LOC103992805 [Musa acuminata subsp. malaccensis]CAG1857863.1 unnamed protein product [Musa acuminata subsp. malaccensis]